MERLPVRSLLSFKAVSKQWKSTIESRFFQERQSKNSQQCGDPDVLMVSSTSLRTLVFGSLPSSSVKMPWGNKTYLVCQSSVDGLVCLYDSHKPGFVVNPITGWYRPLPLSRLQERMILEDGYIELGHLNFKPGFGKDEFTGTRKPVWLYNSIDIGLENATTTCEVFDFSTNSWRYVTPSAPCRILGGFPTPVFVDGSLHWFTECEETEVLSFDLHSETFNVISKAPFASTASHWQILLCNLNNRLCASQLKLSDQVIWSFNSLNKTWDKLWSICIVPTWRSFGFPTWYALSPLAIFVEKKKLLFYDPAHNHTLVLHDPETKSYDAAFSDKSIGYPVCYFPSLISI